MSADEVHVDDIGTVFELTFMDGESVVDVSSATGTTEKRVLFGKPSGATVEQNASFVTDGTDGKISYTTVADDLDEAGWWEVQGYVELTNGSWYSDITRVRVWPNVMEAS